MNSAASDDGAGAKLGDLSRERNLVTVYLKEIGAFGVLTAAEEVRIGRQIEAGRAELQRALAGIPAGVDALLDVDARLRARQLTVEDVVASSDGAPITARQHREILRAFASIHRLRRVPASSPSSRRTVRRIVEAMPLKGRLVDELVATVRRGQESATCPGPAYAGLDRSARALQSAKRHDPPALRDPRSCLEADRSRRSSCERRASGWGGPRGLRLSGLRTRRS